MNDIFYSFNDKISLMLKTLRKEYERIIFDYNEDKLFKKCFPIQASKKCTKEQKKQVDEYINKLFVPTFKTLSPMIDDGIIEWESVSNKVKLPTTQFNYKLYEDLIYESWDKLYIYKYIKYNTLLNFILQLYIVFERELISNIKKYDSSFSDSTLFGAIRFLEKNYNVVISLKIKSKLDLYRNIINVHKHGYGTSYIDIEKNNSDIINFKLNRDTYDYSFLFNLNKISFNELYNVILNFINILN